MSLTRLTLLILTPFIASCDNPSALGRWGVAVSLAPVFSYIMDLALARSVLRFSFTNDSNDRNENVLNFFVKLRLIVFATSSLLLLFVSTVFWSTLSGNQITMWPYFPALIAFGFSEAISFFLTSVLRLSSQPTMLLFVRLAQSLGTLLSVVLYKQFDPNCDAFVIFGFSYFFCSCVAGYFLILRKVLFSAIHSSKSFKLREVLQFSLPLTIHDLSWWLRGTALTLVVANCCEDSVTGFFFASMLIATPFSIFLAGSDQALAVDYYSNRSRGLAMTSSIKAYRSVCVITCLTCYAAMLVAKPLSQQLWPTASDVISSVVPVALLGVVCHSAYIVWVKSLMYLKRTITLLIGSAGISLLGITASILVAPSFGYVGVVWCGTASYLGIAFYCLGASVILKDEPLDIILPSIGICIGLLIAVAL